MPYPEISVIGIDPGGTTGWAHFTIPRKCMYGDEPTRILDWDTGEFRGPEVEHVKAIGSLCRTAQGFSYLVGPALVVEDWDVDPHFKSTDPEAMSPVRIAAMLRYARYRGELGDAMILMQGRTLAKQTMTDERLRRAGLWVEGSPHERDAVRHAITALRRARAKASVRCRMWNEDPRTVGRDG
jgi:hypothetical protein